MGRSTTREEHEAQNDGQTDLECTGITKSASRDTWRPVGRQWFDGLTITLEENGNTLLSGPVADQAALHGLLKKVRDLGLTLALGQFR